MESWSKLKTFFLLIILIGSAVHLSIIGLFSYVLVSRAEEIMLLYLIFLFPVLFIIYSTIVFAKKISGRVKRVFIGFIILIFQLFFSMVFYIVLGLGLFMASAFIPQYEKGNASLIASRFEQEYGIEKIDPSLILHSSYWSIGEEFGYDLIFKMTENNFENYSPEGVSFELLKNNTAETPFRFSSTYFICGSEERIGISDAGLSNLICNKEKYPENVQISEKWVRSDWTITSVYFPTEQILWITEYEW